jgi:hypothetical protein
MEVCAFVIVLVVLVAIANTIISALRGPKEPRENSEMDESAIPLAISKVHEIAKSNLKPDEETRVRNLYTSLRASEDHRLVSQFIRKVATAWSAKEIERVSWTFEQQRLPADSRNVAFSYLASEVQHCVDQISRLQQLLVAKGWVFSDEQVASFVTFELRELRVEEGKKRILRGNPNGKDEILRSYLAISNSEDDIMMASLAHALHERNYGRIPVAALKSEVTQLERAIELRKFEHDLLAEETKAPTPKLDIMSGADFEAFVARLFQRMGYEVERTKLTGDQGADVIVTKFGEKTAIQAKRSAGRIGNKAVQEALGAISLYKADRGNVVTNSFFTRAAIELATANRIELIDGDRLNELVRMYW